MRFSYIVVGLFLVGCGGPKAGTTGDKGHDAYSKTQVGRQAVEGGDGRSVEVKTGVELSQYGVPVLPGAVLPRDNAAYVETGLTTISTTYELTSSKSVLEVAKFYEDELGSKPSILTSEDALVSGRLSDGRGVAVSIIRIQPDEVEVRVQILKNRL